MNIYDRIKDERMKLQMSQDELAKRVGFVSRSSITKIEKGERDINQSLIVKFADALHVTPQYLLTGINGEDTSPQKQEQIPIKELFGTIMTYDDEHIAIFRAWLDAEDDRRQREAAARASAENSVTQDK